MTVPRVLRPALVAIVAAGLTLTACTSPDPAPEPTVTQTTEPAPEPTTDPTEVAAPEQPALMATNDAIGARAAAEYFLSLYGYVFQTGDLTAWDAMCDPLSEFCKEIHVAVAENVENGFLQTGGDLNFTVERVVEPSGQLESFEIAGSTSQSSFEIRAADGTVSTTGPGETGTPTSVFLYMAPDGQWLVRAVVVGGTA